jgi:sugar phosphate permease
MSDVSPEESGLASGVVNTGFMMGGALGLAVLASLAAWKTGGSAAAESLNAGYQLAFVVGGVFAALAAGLAVALLRDRPMEAHGEPEPAPALAVAETD